MMIARSVLRSALAFGAFTLVAVAPASARAQSAPPQVVQSSDGSLYWVQGGNAWSLVPNQISDADQSQLTVSGEIDGTIPDQFLIAPAPPQPAAPEATPAPAAAPQPAPPAPAPAPAAAQPASPPAPAAVTGNVDLTGKVPDDPPGLPLGLGATVTSVVDVHTKPQDVYALDLTAGANYVFLFNSGTSQGTVQVYLLNPDTSVAYHFGIYLSNAQCAGSCALTVAKSGTYYLKIAADQSGDRYKFTWKQT